MLLEVFKKAILISSLTLSLIGCGFQPMLKSEGQEKQSFILKVKGEGYPAYIFRREIEKQLALIPRLSLHTYQIDIQLAGTEEAATYAQTAAVTRMRTTLSATYTISCKNGAPLSFSESIISPSHSIVTSYPVIAHDEFISRNADITVKTRAMISLAQEVSLGILGNLKKELKN